MSGNSISCTLAKKFDYSSFFSNVVTGIYHFLIVHAINKYGLQFIYRSSSIQLLLEKIGITPLISTAEKRLASVTGYVPPSKENLESTFIESDRDLEERLSELEMNWRDRMYNLSNFEILQREEEGTGTLRFLVMPGEEIQDLISVENDSLEEDIIPETVDPYAHADFLALLASDSEEESGLVYDESMFNTSSVPSGRYFTCLLVLSFRTPLPQEDMFNMVERLKKLFGANPRVEKFRDTTVLRMKVWTHEYLFDDMETLVKEAHELDEHCTLQLGTWGIFMSFTGQQVELLKLQGGDMPLLGRATQVSAGSIEMKGRHLTGCKVIAVTPDGSAYLPYVSQSERGQGAVEVLTVQVPYLIQDRSLHVYAVKNLDIDGFSVTVRTDSVYIDFDDIRQSQPPRDPSAVILTTLIIAVPVAHISWSVIVPTPNSTTVAVAGQVLGWILGWILLRLLVGRYSEKQSTGKLLDDIPFLAKWRRFVALIVVMLLSFLSWRRLAVLDPRLMLLGTAVATILGVAVRGRFKLLETHKEVETACKLAYWVKVMKTSVTYDEWAQAANKIETGGRMVPLELGDFYDESFVRSKLGELQSRRLERGAESMRYYLQGDLFRNLGGMCNQDLHRGRQQTPPLIRDYLNEVRYHLHAICEMDPDDFTLDQKLAFLHETRQKFGRTALVFSGQVEYGTFHSNVFRTLVEHRLLPSVVTGSGEGAVVASFATTRTYEDLQLFFDDPMPAIMPKIGAVYVACFRLRKPDAGTYEVEKLQESLQDLIGDLTFKEAFELSGRILSFLIADPPHFLSYITCPHVVIWSAVAVSCAPPNGSFKSPELMSKAYSGDIVPCMRPMSVTVPRHHGHTRIESEIPYQQLRELFNINHFIVSQASLYVAPLLYLKEKVESWGGGCLRKVVELVEMEVKYRCSVLNKLGLRVGGLTRLFSQKWEGDINIIMPFSFSQAFSKSTGSMPDEPSPEELRKSAVEGRRCTWAKLSAIQASCGVELMLDECILQLIRQRNAFRNFDNSENGNAIQGDTLVRESEAQELGDASTLRHSFDPDHDADEIFQAMRLGKASGGCIWGDSDLEFDIEDMDIDEPYDPFEQESNQEVEETFEGARLELDVEDILDSGMSYADELSQTRLDAEEILGGFMLKEGLFTESEHDSIQDHEVVSPVHATRNEHESTFDHHLSIQERVGNGEVVDPVHTTKDEHGNSHHLWTRDTDEICEAVDPVSATGNEPERTDRLTVQETEENGDVVHLGHALENEVDNVRGKDLCVYVTEEVGEIVHLSHARENKHNQTKGISDNGLINDKLEKEDAHMDLNMQTVESMSLSTSGNISTRIDLFKDKAGELEKVEGETPLIVLEGTFESTSKCSLSQGAYEEIFVREKQCDKVPLLKNPDADGDDMDSKTANPKQILITPNSVSDASQHIDLSESAVETAGSTK